MLNRRTVRWRWQQCASECTLACACLFVSSVDPVHVVLLAFHRIFQNLRIIQTQVLRSRAEWHSALWCSLREGERKGGMDGGRNEGSERASEEGSPQYIVSAVDALEHFFVSTFVRMVRQAELVIALLNL